MFINIVEQEIQSFLKEVVRFCSNRKIKPTLDNFLEYKTEGKYMPDCLYLLMGKKYSKFYLFNSKKFITFWKKLPQDFKKDIVNSADLEKIKLQTLADSKLKQYLSDVLKEDFIWR